MFYSRQDLADYCLRTLGGGVVNVEVSPEQIDDAIQEAIDYYREYHFDGVDIDYLKYKITGSVLALTDATAFAVGDTITGATSACVVKITAVSGNNVTITRMGGDDFQTGETITNQKGDSTTIVTISKGDLDNQYLTVDDTVVGVTKVLNLSSVLSNSDYMFNAQYQVMLSEIQNLAAGSTQYLYSTLSYMSHLDFIMRKEKTFRFNRRTNKVFLDINWDADIKMSDYIILEVYRYIDDDVYTNLLNDIWLKEYSTSLIKLRWGTNLKKYTGVQLPGGITYNGQQIYDEAVQDKQRLEEDLITKSSPLAFMIG